MSLSLNQDVPDDIVMAIGRIAIECAGIDYFIGYVVARLERLDPQQTDDLIHPTDTRRKNERLFKAALDEKTRDLSKEIEDILIERNLVIHGLPIMPDQLEGPKAFLTFRGKYKKKPVIQDIQKLNALLDRASKANNCLMYMLSGPDWPAEKPQASPDRLSEAGL